jgi:DNA-binding beta-propeller fold protein YncE
VARFGKVGTALGDDNYPDSIAISAGYAWIADTKNHRIESWNVATRAAVSTYTISGSLASTPAGISVDPTTGNLLVADSANDQVLELSVSGGSVTGIVRTFTDGFNAPFGVAANGTYVAVADRDNNRVIVFDESSGNVVTSITGSDVTGGGPTALYHPENVAFGPNGNLYIADTYNDRILEYSVS